MSVNGMLLHFYQFTEIILMPLFAKRQRRCRSPGFLPSYR